ncbi:helix-turn-helix domain-containing protein [Nocardia brasiliensis]|uniref:helix-turn-helix domain-containing protein n=1 Tax=Nocardia brasiliensis TaxID=37326 RepID=UPI0033FAEAB6
MAAVVSGRDTARRKAVRRLLDRATRGVAPMTHPSTLARHWPSRTCGRDGRRTRGIRGRCRASAGPARGWRPAELRKHRGLSQKQVAEQMRVSVARVSQIEKGEVATREVLDRYVSALGGVLKLVADFGDEQLRVG